MEWKLLIVPETVSPKELGVNKPSEKWVSDVLWNSVLRVERVVPGIELKKVSSLKFPGFVDNFVRSLSDWKMFIESEKPSVGKSLPNDFDSKISDIQRLLILRALTNEKLLFEEFFEFAQKHLPDPDFLAPYVLDLEKIYLESSNQTPIMFVSNDESNSLQIPKRIGKLATSKAVTKLQVIFSMRVVSHEICAAGSATDAPKLEELILKAAAEGGWILVQNIHLCPDALITIERFSNNGNAEPCHDNFRLFLTTSPSRSFPVISNWFLSFTNSDVCYPTCN